MGFFNTCLIFGLSSLNPLWNIDDTGINLAGSLVAENHDKPAVHYTEIEDNLFQDRLQEISKQMTLEYNSVVKKEILRYFYHPKSTEVILGRALNFKNVFSDIVASYGLPPAIANLPIIESGVVCDAKSSAGAYGFWQFMKGTGKLYDLEMSDKLDERKDPEKSTHAAAQYLTDLYGDFDDWLLALAAYNCGPGNVRKAIRRSGGGKKTYWEIRNYLPRETRYYVPRFIAANYVMNYYFMHDLTPKIPYETWIYDYLLTVDQDWDIAKFTGDFKVSEQEFRRLNPSILGDIIPAKSRPMTLRMPFPPNSNQPPMVMTVEEKIEDVKTERLVEHSSVETISPRSIKFINEPEVVLNLEKK